MGISAFTEGTMVQFEKKFYVLLRKVSDDIWQLEESRTKRICEYSNEQLLCMYQNNQLTFVNPNAIINQKKGTQSYLHPTEQQWEQAKIRRSYVIATLNIPNTKKKLIPAIHATWKKLNKPKKVPNSITVLRWKNKYIMYGQDILSLVDRHDKKGNGQPRYPQEVVDFVKAAIDTKYLLNERGTIQDALDEAQTLVKNENILRPKEIQLPLPTQKLVKGLIHSVPAYDRYAARHSRTEANTKFRAVLGHRITYEPLERAEIDHTPLDLMVIDDDTGLPLGRPWITALIDDYSRCILGLHISFTPPSYLTVSYCLRHAFCPKNDLKDKYPIINNKWDAYGVVRELVVDNGLEFHSISLENACYTLGIEIHYAPRKAGWFKGKIEKFLRTFNESLAHKAPGTTFANVFDKGDYDPLKHAVVRKSIFKAIAHKWVADYYHQKEHRTLHASPASVWRNAIRPEDIFLPDNLITLDAILGRSESRTLTHKGIELNYLFYNSPELTTLRRQLGDNLKVEVRVDESNLGFINVLSPDQSQVFRVPALRFEYANGLTSWQHKVCRNYAISQLEKTDPTAWLQAKKDIHTLIDEEFLYKKHKTRTKIARFIEPFEQELQPEPSSSQLLLSQAEEVVETHQGVANETESMSEKNPQPKIKFKPEYRDRNPSLIQTEQAESIRNVTK